MRFLKIYTHNMTLIDEVYDYSKLEYSKGLNTIDTLTFEIPLHSPQATPHTLEFMNKIEYVEVTLKDGYEKTRIIWEGLIVDRTFNASSISIGCYSRLFLLSKRRIKNDKFFEDEKVHEIIKYIVNDCNSDLDIDINDDIDNSEGGTITSFTNKSEKNIDSITPKAPFQPYTLILGDIAKTNVTAQRDIKNTDMALDTIISLVESKGFYVDSIGDKLNFYTTYGKTKSNYVLQFSNSGEGDNLLRLPSLNQTVTDTVNDVFGRVDWEETKEGSKEGEESITIAHTLSANRVNEKSIDLYGRLEGVADVHDSTRLLKSLKSSLDKELEVLSWATNSIDVEAIDTWLCPFDDIQVGDRVTLSLEPYFGFKTEVRILEITYSEESKTYKLSLGNTVYKTEKPKYRLYSKNDIAVTGNTYSERMR